MSDPLKIIKAAQAATDKLTATEQQLRARHTALVRERDRTWHALASRSEVRDQARRLVTEAGARWRATHGASWVRALSGYRELRGVEPVRERAVPPRLPDLVPGDLTLPALCGLVPDALVASLEAMIEAQPDTVFGLPADARQRRLAELDAEIAAVAAEHTALVDGAAAAGLTLPLLDVERERREAEADRADRERALAAARAARALS